MSDHEDVTKAILRPKNEGEDLKIKQVVLKRRDRNLKARAQQAKKIADERANRKGKKVDARVFQPALLVKKALNKKKEKFRLKRLEKKKQVKVQENTVLVAVRNRRQVAGNKPVLNKLKDLKLKKYNNLVFVANTEQNLKDLRMVGPYVAYGKPNYKTVTDLLHRKAMFKAPGSSKKVILSSNQLIEEHLGDMGLLCVEDLVDRIWKGSDEEVEQVTAKLWPIELGDYTQHKAEGFKVNIHEHRSGDLKAKISEHIQEVL